MDSSDRRRFIKLAGLSGLVSIAGCSQNNQTPTDEAGTTSSTSSATDSETVVFTDSETSTSSTTTSDLRFDGGTLSDFVAALRTADQQDISKVQIAPGTYRFDPLSAVESGSKDPHATIADINDVLVDGPEATFVFTNPTRAGLRFTNGSNITFRGLTFDYDPVPFTQGEIVELDDGGETITLALDEGYPSLDHEMFDTAARVWASVHESDGSFISGVREKEFYDKLFSSIEKVGDRRFKLRVRVGTARGLAVGRRLTVVARNHGTALAFYMTDQPRLEDLTCRASGGACFSVEVCRDPVVQGTTIAPPPESNRQVASDADGVRVVNCLSSAVVEKCRHEKLLDDSIVVQNAFTKVSEVVDDRTIAVELVHPFVVTEGDRLGVQAVNGTRKEMLPPIAAYEAAFDSPGERDKPTQIEFEGPIAEQVAAGDYVGNFTTGSRNFTVRDNELRNHRGILVRVSATQGTVTNNVLAGVSRNPIELESEFVEVYAPKGRGWVSDVTVTENTIRRAGLAYFAGDHPAAIRLHHLAPEGVPTQGQPHRNIEIANNDIEECAQGGIDVEAAQNVRIEENSIRDVNLLDYPAGGYGVLLENSTNVRVENTSVTGSEALITAFGRREAVSELTSSGNELVLAGDATEAQFQRWVDIRFKFNRTVQPQGDGRHLAIRCYRLRLQAGGEILKEYDIGGDERGVELERGYFTPESAESGTYRWLGGADATTSLSLPNEELDRADTLALEAYPIERGLEAAASIGGDSITEIQFGEERKQWYEIKL